MENGARKITCRSAVCTNLEWIKHVHTQLFWKISIMSTSCSVQILMESFLKDSLLNRNNSSIWMSELMDEWMKFGQVWSHCGFIHRRIGWSWFILIDQECSVLQYINMRMAMALWSMHYFLTEKELSGKGHCCSSQWHANCWQAFDRACCANKYSRQCNCKSCWIVLIKNF